MLRHPPIVVRASEALPKLGVLAWFGPDGGPEIINANRCAGILGGGWEREWEMPREGNERARPLDGAVAGKLCPELFQVGVARLHGGFESSDICRWELSSVRDLAVESR
jgi:hypothetical protein